MKKKRKNSNYKISFENEAAKGKGSNNKFLITFVSIFLAVAVIVGASFGIAEGVKNSKAVVKYEGITLTAEEVSFFATYYKYQMLSNLTKNGIDATDSPEFWESKCPVAESYGALLEYNTRQYVMQILVGNYIFDRYDYLSSDEKKEIKKAAKEILTYHANGNEEVFNSGTSQFGFYYDDFEEICRKLYKARMADVAVFGTDGSKIASETELCKTYYSEYSRVKLMFIRTDKEFVLDEDGNRVTENGKDAMRDLTEEEKAERLADIETIRNAIHAFENDGEYQMSAIMFENYLAKYGSGDKLKDENGYFFHEDSSFTKEFSSGFSKDITTAALNMSVGSFKEVETTAGICFIYKLPVDVNDGAYADTTDKNGCFDDFYADAAKASFDAMVNVFIKDVEIIEEKYEKIDVIGMPYNGTFVPRF